jgi:hypothetical protein
MVSDLRHFARIGVSTFAVSADPEAEFPFMGYQVISISISPVRYILSPSLDYLVQISYCKPWYPRR